MNIAKGKTAGPSGGPRKAKRGVAQPRSIRCRTVANGIPATKKARRQVALYLRSAIYDRRSIKNQRLELKKLCGPKDWQIARVYEDCGYSGMTFDRPGLRDMLRAAERGEFGVLIVAGMSRLSRSDHGALDLVGHLGLMGVDVCANGTIITGGPTCSPESLELIKQLCAALDMRCPTCGKPRRPAG